jgi:hypothetical protein
MTPKLISHPIYINLLFILLLHIMIHPKRAKHKHRPRYGENR